MIYTERNFETLEYLMSFPDGFDEKKKYPLIISLHGAGLRNSSCENLKISKIYETLDKYGFEFIVVAPLCRKETWFDHFPSLEALVDFVSKDKNVDSDRVYLTGNSMGGYGTWQLAMSIPEYFAAIAPVCGGGMYWNAKRLSNMGVWAFHGALDNTVYVEESEKMVDSVNRRGGNNNAKLTVYPDREHDSWTPTYTNPDLYRWFLSNVRNGNVESENFGDKKTFG